MVYPGSGACRVLGGATVRPHFKYPPGPRPGTTCCTRHQTKAKAATSKRRKLEKPLADTDPATAAEDPAWADLQPVLDEEVGRLPRKYREPFVLCYVEGRTNEQAARVLG